MINLDYLSPIISSISGSKVIIKGRAVGRTFGIISICASTLPMLEWDYSHTSIFFNPKKIPKVKNKKLRKACYQAFALYKKSFKPVPKLKTKMWKDEWPLMMRKAAQYCSNHAADAFSFFAHCYKERAKFAAQYERSWDLSK